jgi:hypothetical protein
VFQSAVLDATTSNGIRARLLTILTPDRAPRPRAPRYLPSRKLPRAEFTRAGLMAEGMEIRVLVKRD